eukprot:9408591-Lingulodinium_polyedra.AAC.1
MFDPLRQRSAGSTSPWRSGSQTLRNDAVKSTFRCRGGSRVARLRVPRAERNWFARGVRGRA